MVSVMRRRGATRLALGALILLATGCPRSTGALICNNSGKAQHINVKGGAALRWNNGSVVRLGEGGSITWSQLEWAQARPDGTQVPVLSLRGDPGRLDYLLDWGTLSARHVDSRSDTSKFFFQLEADGRLYAVTANSKCPVPQLPKQPEGMPIKAR